MIPLILRRASLIVASVVVSLAVAELSLDAGAWVVRTTGRSAPAGWLTGSKRILCVGDSNTYGMWLDREFSYPEQLEQQWNSREGASPIEVINFGYPGNNSSRARRDLKGMLDRYAPDVVLIMIGANDGWTEPVVVDAEPATFGERLWRISRVYRLLYMAAHATDMRARKDAIRGAPDVELPTLHTDPHLSFPDWQEPFRANIDAMISMVRERGIIAVLLTYPAHDNVYAFVNPLIREAAVRNGAPLIDTTKAVKAACGDPACEGLFLWDFHASALGNQIVARAVIDSGEVR